MKKFAVVLSGCGVFDGAEIYESVLTLQALERNNIEYQCFAPNIEQMHVINHLTGEVAEGESRNVLVEAARIARGEIKDLAEAKADEFDAVILPGGFGAAKNLSDFAVKGSDCAVNPELVRFIQGFADAKKPVGFVCIAPAMLPLIFGKGTKLTIGNDEETAKAIEAMGGVHVACQVDDIVVDEDKQLVTTPAYMLAGSISEAAKGINKLVDKMVSMLG
ncbi:isoprenoid biosynthesis glyoxalase ElbB [Kangiella sediminilitoris]|uniref:Glyoxalase n=1 Tax=Kangiella sediminilitoris TaxID=1144748 RepID=A0A1B3B7W3_9GAMM|nr:isoprenoid biosynthesis glyoxalase ElbB [Kangiella sediminilitoris]AOE48866.1 isoprenoid biosynthesis protein [Kangiella sediminilitoris]